MALPNKLYKLACLEACCAVGMPVIGGNALCMALAALQYCVCALAFCMGLYSAGGATGIPGTLEKDIGAPGSMLIGLCMTGGKIGPATCKGAGAPVPVHSS